MGKINQVNLVSEPFLKSQSISSSRIWYALQTFYQKEAQLGKLFKELGLNYFIPMCPYQSERLTEFEMDWKPVVHNLLFLEKTDKESVIISRLRNIPIPFRLYRNRETNKIYEISDRSIMELRAACDPSYRGNLYMDAQQAQDRPGYMVQVIRGPFAGLTGKLTQYKKKYYVVITVASLGVLLHIPRWYCRKIE